MPPHPASTPETDSVFSGSRIDELQQLARQVQELLRSGLQLPRSTENAGADALLTDVNRIALLPLQRIGLHLSATVTIVDASAAARLRQAIAEIDHVIADLRAVTTGSWSAAS